MAQKGASFRLIVGWLEHNEAEMNVPGYAAYSFWTKIRYLTIGRD